MDRELSEEYKKKQRMKLYLTIGFSASIIFILFLAFRSFVKPTIEKSSIVTVVAEKGSLESTLNASGIVVPEFEFLLTSPVSGRIEKIILNAGEPVKEGESIIQINKESTLNQYNKLVDEQEVKKNKKAQLSLNLEKSLNDLQTQYSIKELKIKSLQTAVDHEDELLKVGGSTKENLKQAQLNLQVAEYELIQLQNHITNQKEMMKVDLNSLGYEMKIQEKTIKEYENKLQQAEIQSPKNGVVTWVKDIIGSTVNEGTEVAKIADLTSFKIEGSISDTYAEHLKTGGGVIVKINDKELRGTISNIKPRVENGIVNFNINLEEKNYPGLRSNAKVDVFVITSFKENIVRVKNGPTFNGSKEQTIFIVKGNEAVARKVITGESNFDYIEIQSGINPGEEVIITDMQEYRHLDKLLIK